MTSFFKKHSVWVAIGLPTALATLVMDQVSKWLVINVIGLDHRGSVELLPFLNFTWVKNTGSAMNLIAINDQGDHWFLLGITLAISVGVLVAMVRTTRRLSSLALGAILGGAIGNLIDRIHLGYVIDFIHFHVGTWSFYVFNIADSTISVGVLALILQGVSTSQPAEQ